MKHREGKRRRFLVLGCGSIGKRHIGNLLACHEDEILAFDVRDDRRGNVESKFGVETLDNLEKAWERGPDVALITAPTSLHIPLALQAAQQGCHLFIEKPLSNAWEGVEQLLTIVKERNLITLVGCNMRFHPGLLRLKRMLEERAIGNVVAAQVEFGQYLPDWHPWEDYRQGYSARSQLGGGVILDAIHEIDYLRWLLGEVETVACFSGKLSHLEIDTEDTAAVLVRFTGGIIGEVHLDYVQRSYRRTCQIIGDEGTLHWDYASGTVKWYGPAGKCDSFANPAYWEPNQMYVDEMRHFLRCLAREESPAVDVFEGARTLQVALAAKASAKAGQVVDRSK